MAADHEPPRHPPPDQSNPNGFLDTVAARSRAVAEAPHPIAALFHVTTAVAREFGASRCSVIGPFGPAVVRILASSDAEPAEDLVISLDRYPELRLALESGEPVLIRDVNVSQLLRPVRELVLHAATVSIATVPLRFPELMGILRITSRSRQFTPSDLERLRATAHVIERELAQTSGPDLDDGPWAVLARQLATVVLDVAGDTRVVSISCDPSDPLERQFKGLIGRPITDALSEPGHDGIGPSVVELMQGRSPTSRHPLVARFANGQRALFHAVAAPCRHPVFRVRIGLRTAEETQREEERMLDMVAVPLVVIEPRESLVATANRAAAELLGQSRETLAGRPLSEFLIRKKHRFRLRDMPDITGELRTCRTEAGDTSRDRMVVALVPDERASDADNRLQSAFQRQSEELELLRRKVDELAARRTLFLAASAHELKTPLTILQIYLETLLGDLSDGMTEEQIEFLHITHQSLLRLRRQVLNLVDLAALESGDFELAIERIKLGHVLAEIAAEMKPLARHSGVDLTLEVAEGLPDARADADRLKQLVRNLVDNAIKYTPAEGRVRVKAAATGHSIIVTVEDTGIGIPEDQLDNVFLEYVRLGGNEQDGDSGSGLGLAVSRRLATALGGRISVTSKLGEGTTFALRLPQWPADQA